MTQQNYHGLFKVILNHAKTIPNLPPETAIEYGVADGNVTAHLYSHVVPQRFVQLAVAMDTHNLAVELLQNLGNRDIIHAIGKKLQTI